MTLGLVSTDSPPKRGFAADVSTSSTDPIGGPDNLPAARRTSRRTGAGRALLVVVPPTMPTSPTR